MQDIISQVMHLKRPKTLVGAATFGIDDYVRSRHLHRCLQTDDALPGPGPALIALLDIEKQLNSDRLSQSGNYAAARHIDILIAIMAEAKLFRATSGSDLRAVEQV